MERKIKRILIPVIVVAVALVAAAIAFLIFVTVRNNGTSVNVEIPFVSDFTCAYYDADGGRISNPESVNFNPEDDFYVEIGFTMSTDAFNAGKKKFVVKFVADDGISGRIVEANTSSTSDTDLTAAFATDDKAVKKCSIRARISVNYSRGDLKVVCYYDDDSYIDVCKTTIRGRSIEVDERLWSELVAEGYARPQLA